MNKNLFIKLKMCPLPAKNDSTTHLQNDLLSQKSISFRDRNLSYNEVVQIREVDCIAISGYRNSMRHFQLSRQAVSIRISTCSGSGNCTDCSICIPNFSRTYSYPLAELI